jgi:cytochrome c heme-lyase
MAPLPFDRHDWVVDRCGQDHRYIIDYYAEPTSEDDVPNIFLDVRPALTFSGALDRMRMYWKQRSEANEVIVGEARSAQTAAE